MFQLFHHSLMFPSLNQALLLPCLFSIWKRGRGKGRNEDGKGRFCKQEPFSGCGAAHPEPDCATRTQTAQRTPSLETFPRNQAFFGTAGCWWFASMKFIPLLLLPRAEQRPHESWAALGALSSSGCSRVAALARAVGWNTSWSWIPGLSCVSPYFHFPSISRVSPPTPSVPALTQLRIQSVLPGPGIQNSLTNMPWLGSFCSLLYFRKTLCFKRSRKFLNKPLLFKGNNQCWGF